MNLRPVFAALLLASTTTALAQSRPSIFHDRPGTLASNGSVADIEALLQTGRWTATVADKRTSTWESSTITFAHDGNATIATLYASGWNTTVRPYRATKTPSGAIVTIGGSEVYAIRPCPAAAATTTCLEGRTPVN